MPKGKVDWRLSKRSGNWRARFYEIHDDEKETIEQALAAARKEMGTDYDSVALEMMCLSYLACGNVKSTTSL